MLGPGVGSRAEATVAWWQAHQNPGLGCSPKGWVSLAQHVFEFVIEHSCSDLQQEVDPRGVQPIDERAKKQGELSPDAGGRVGQTSGE